MRIAAGDRLWLLAAFGVTLVAYRDILRTPLYADDYLHLYQIVNEPLASVVFRPFAGHLYVLPTLLFAVLHRIAGPLAPAYFAVIVLLHLVAVAGLFVLVRRTTANGLLAAVAAASWGAKPLFVSALAWFSVVGAVLAVALCLWGLVPLVPAASRGPVDEHAIDGRSGVLVGVGASLLGAALSFGTGIAVAMIGPLFTWLWMESPRRQRSINRVLVGLPVVVLAIYGWCHLMFADHPQNAVTFPQGFVASALRMLAGMTGFGTAHVSWSLPLPQDLVLSDRMTIGLTVSTALLLLGAAWRGGRPCRRACAGLLVGALAQYALVALGRAGLYSQLGPRVIPHSFGEPRYQYAPMAFLTAACATALPALRVGVPGRRTLAPLATVAWFAATLLVLLRKPIPASTFPGIHEEIERFLGEVHDRLDAAKDGAPVYVRNRPFVSAGPLLAFAPELYPGWAATFTIFFDSNEVQGHQVFFVEPDPAVRAAAQRLPGSRISQLLVAPDAVPPG